MLEAETLAKEIAFKVFNRRRRRMGEPPILPTPANADEHWLSLDKDDRANWIDMAEAAMETRLVRSETKPPWGHKVILYAYVPGGVANAETAADHIIRQVELPNVEMGINIETVHDRPIAQVAS